MHQKVIPEFSEQVNSGHLKTDVFQYTRMTAQGEACFFLSAPSEKNNEMTLSHPPGFLQQQPKGCEHEQGAASSGVKGSVCSPEHKENSHQERP